MNSAEAHEVMVEFMSSLSPCPFCGAKDLKVFVYPEMGVGVQSVGCKKCASMGPPTAGGMDAAGRAWNYRIQSEATK